MFGLDLWDGIAIIYFFLGIRSVITAWRERKNLTDDQLTARDRYLLGQIAFFVLVPPGVFLHELGHVLATLQVGGHIGGFHYALFYGYVIPLGNFTPLQEWWIALSGNLVSIVYGLLAIPLIPRVSAKWLKYLLLAFARVQLIWALIGYPLFTLVGFGDWSTIYNPQTWYVGVPFGISQLALIAALFFVNRSTRVRLWEASLFAENDAHLRDGGNTLADPAPNAATMLKRGMVFANSDMNDLARANFQAVLKQDPQHPLALLRLAQTEYDDRNIPAARRHFQQALAASGNEPTIAADCYYFLALILAEQGKFNDAIASYTDAVRLNPDKASYYYWRGMAWRALREKNRASTDFLQAAKLFDATHPDWAKQAREMAFEEN